MPLKQYVTNNEAVLQLSVENKLINAAQSESLKYSEFIDSVEQNKSIGINIRSELIFDIINTGFYLNIFQLGWTSEKIKQKYNNAWADGIDYYSRLLIFLELFDANKLIKYCSINTGNLGLRLNEFGGGHTYVVLKNEFVEQNSALFNIYCLAEYSLSYFDDNLDFLIEKFQAEISSFSNVEDLAFLKHYHQILSTDPSNFKDLVAGGFNVIEVLVFNEIKISDIELIRISKRTYDSLNTKDFKNLSDAQKYRYLNLKKIIEKSDELNIQINFI